MTFIPTPVSAGTSSPQYPYSTPLRAEFSVVDDGSGGQLFVNAGGLNGASQMDLETFFGTQFRSWALAAAFTRNYLATQTIANLNLIFRDIEVLIVGRDSAAATAAPSYLPVIVSNTPGFNFVGPGAAGTWRVTIRLRQSSEI